MPHTELMIIEVRSYKRHSATHSNGNATMDNVLIHRIHVMVYGIAGEQMLNGLKFGTIINMQYK